MKIEKSGNFQEHKFHCPICSAIFISQKGEFQAREDIKIDHRIIEDTGFFSFFCHTKYKVTTTFYHVFTCTCPECGNEVEDWVKDKETSETKTYFD